MPLNLEDLLYPSAAAATRIDWTQIDEKVKSASNTLATNGLSTVALDQESWPPFASTSKVTLEALPDDLTVSAWLDLIIPGEENRNHAIQLLTSQATDDVIADQLVELFGYDRIDSIPQALARREALRREIAKPASSPLNPQASLWEPTPARSTTAPSTSAVAQGGYVPQAQITFETLQSKAEAKRLRNEARKHGHMQQKNAGPEYTLEEMQRIREAELQAASSRPLASGNSRDQQEEPKYPHIYAATQSGSTLSFSGQKYSLPAGTKRIAHEKYEEVIIPTPSIMPMRSEERLRSIAELDPLARGSFPGYTTLNRLQSVVFPTAYESNENMLVCAPTGAGKTDVAVLAVLRAIAQNSTLIPAADGNRARLSSYDFKIVYVAPMKALAAEITRKMSKRLNWLGVSVRELTGDMQLTRKEIAETQVIITTPEKWAVVTNKSSSEEELTSKLRLLIIDEVHLLHDDRGAVIETIVARTLRMVESSQLLIRIVGLSATLPNYIDVADFLGVNRYQGLFYFDQSFRPVPLEQHFLGVKGKVNSSASRENLDIATFDKVSDLLRDGHQVMVFVHARKETVKTAMMLRDRVKAEGMHDLVDATLNDKYNLFKRDVGQSRNREMRELFQDGFGIHHAGMLRSDRTLSERMFEQNVTKVLVCTATLAWGVNLPAYAVVIKGTQIYDASKGSFVDLSILDVLQIFGRAGRPQYETHGIGYICTTADKVDHYVSAITEQHPIESKFVQGILNALNAEIALGTVSTIDEGVRWIGYTFLFVRMRKNPMVYGLTQVDVENDPSLGQKRHQLMTIAARQLASYEMVTYDADSGSLTSTDLGITASKYYLNAKSIETFNPIFKPRMTEADTLWVLSQSQEFEQIPVRDSEVPELKTLSESVPCDIRGAVQTTPGKVNVLLQSFISRRFIEDFALVSDSAYVAQNAARIARAMFEIAVSRKWSESARVILSLCKAIEKRMWPFDNPIGQFELPADIVYNISQYADDWDARDLAALPPAELGALIHLNERLGTMAQTAASHLPRFTFEFVLEPLASDLLRIQVTATKDFVWSSKLHGSMENFWLWLSDADDTNILQMTSLQLQASMTELSFEFLTTVPKLPSHFNIHLSSDRWMDSDETVLVPCDGVQMPAVESYKTQLQDIPLFNVSEKPGLRRSLVRSPASLGPMDTQVYHSLAHTTANCIICLPDHFNRLQLVLLSIFDCLSKSSNAAILVLTLPRNVLTINRLIKQHLGHLGLRCQIIQSDSKIDAQIETDSGPRCFIASPYALAHRSTSSMASLTATVSLVVADEIHSMNAIYETVLSRLPHSLRRICFSAPMLNPLDQAAWLHCKEEHVYSFASSDRSTSLETSFQTFSSTTNPTTLLRNMIKPIHRAVQSAGSSAICFVSSRNQCLIAALALIKHSGSDLETLAFVGDGEVLEVVSQQIRDHDSKEALLHGIALYHEAMAPIEKRLMMQTWKSGAARLMVATRGCAWVDDLVAPLVIVAGTQDASIGKDGTRTLRDYDINDLLQMQSCAAVSSATGNNQCLILCQPAQADVYSRFLRDGLLSESSFSQDSHLQLYLLQSISVKATSRHELIKSMSTTFWARRLHTNPSFYGCPADLSRNVFASRKMDTALEELADLGCIQLGTQGSPALWPIGESVLLRKYDIQQLKALQKSSFGKVMGQLGKATDLPNTGHDVKQTLSHYYTHLPRGIRAKLDVADNDLETSKAKILLAGFLNKRIPADVVLRLQQRDVVDVILQAKV